MIFTALIGNGRGFDGRLTQLVEWQPVKLFVASSSLASSAYIQLIGISLLMSFLFEVKRMPMKDPDVWALIWAWLQINFGNGSIQSAGAAVLCRF